MDLWRQISTAFFLVLVALSSVALMVGGIGVMAIMLVSVTERTREIGIRKAIGAQRGDILYQFLAEAAALAAVGGAIGVGHRLRYRLRDLLATGFPVSLPWWSFAVPVAFSSLIGIFFGIYPASRAAGLDPRTERPAGRSRRLDCAHQRHRQRRLDRRPAAPAITGS